jgi:hypothetical protein
MRYFRKRIRSRRFLLVSAIVGLVVLGGSAIAYAAYPNNGVAVMTGCLTTSGTGSGQIVNVAMGTNPAKACGANQKQVQLSGGTITRITAGTGLSTTGSGGTGGTGYINNGFATLGLQDSYALPQNCGPNQVPDWGGIENPKWICANDQNTTYSASTGLDLSNSKAFSIDSTYQLPQSCQNGQIPGWTGSAWICADDQNTTYSGKDFATSGQDCPAGQFATGIDGNGALKCAQPTVDDLSGSPCNFDGHTSSLQVKTDGVTGAVSITCKPTLLNVGVKVSGGVTVPHVGITDNTTGFETDFTNVSSDVNLQIPAGHSVTIDLENFNILGLTYNCDASLGGGDPLVQGASCNMASLTKDFIAGVSLGGS